MCLVLIAYQAHPEYPLVIAANRDEYFDRPTVRAGFWEDEPSIFAGRDLRNMGTWFGVDAQGRYAAVTNYMGASINKPVWMSRGLLVSDYLKGQLSAAEYLEKVIAAIPRMDAFNLIVGNLAALYFLSSREQRSRKLGPGIYGVSNGDFDSPWPKVKRGKAYLRDQLTSCPEPDYRDYFALLADTSVPDKEQLPETGIDPDRERQLAAIFVRAGDYGTRSSTVLLYSKKGEIDFNERYFNRSGEVIDNVSCKFMIKSPE